jgi:ATP-dependent exoDNAse (exonuclease V) alpha subunit
MSSQNTAFDANSVRPVLEDYLVQHSSNLDNSQWNALEVSLSRRLSLIWGPPGTGKSRTLRAAILGAVIDADNRGEHLRVLVTAATNTALDNVVID